MPSRFFKAIAIIGLLTVVGYLGLDQLQTSFKPSEKKTFDKAEQSTMLDKPAPSKATEDAVAESIPVAPASAEPASVEPASVEPASVEPASVEPAAVEPAAVEQASVEQASVEPAAVESTPDISELAESDFVDSLTEEAKSMQKMQEAPKPSVIPFKSATQSAPQEQQIIDFCKVFSNKLRTIKNEGCLQLGLQITDAYQSVQERPLTYRHFRSNTETKPDSNGRILFISGIHGDEYSAISITYLWMLNMLKHENENSQHWLFLPLANPDGLFRDPATRINANDVDVNRNFPSPDWDELALDYWTNYYKKNKRRYPGPNSNSEPETQWIVDIIDEFKPDAIISVHAPYGLVDYDGPDHAVPNKIGALKHRELGTYPGSLGRYAGEYLKIPVLTLELRAAGTMPSDKEIYTMWKDVEEWTSTKVKGEITPLPSSLRAQ